MDAGRSASDERRPDPKRWTGPDFGDVFWNGDDPATIDAVFDVVFDEDAVEPRPGETPEGWRARVEEAVRERADQRRATDTPHAHPPRPSR